MERIGDVFKRAIYTVIAAPVGFYVLKIFFDGDYMRAFYATQPAYIVAALSSGIPVIWILGSIYWTIAPLLEKPKPKYPPEQRL